MFLFLWLNSFFPFTGSFVVEGDEEDRYACLIPIMKAVLEKAGHDLELEAALPALSPLNSSFFDQFPLIRDDDAWKMWMEEQVHRLHISLLVFTRHHWLQLGVDISIFEIF